MGKIFIGPPKPTKYERARIVGARALQISMGAPILISLLEEVNDPINIALMELEEGVLPITIRRTLPDSTYQDIPLSRLIGGRKSSEEGSSFEGGSSSDAWSSLILS